MYDSKSKVAKTGIAFEPISKDSFPEMRRMAQMDENPRHSPSLQRMIIKPTTLNKNDGKRNCSPTLLQAVIPGMKQEGMPKSRLSHEMQYCSAT